MQIRKGAWYYGDRQKEWTLKDIQNKLSDDYLADNELIFSIIEYAYLDCGNDGVEEFAVRFVAPDIYCTVTMIITCKDKSLEVVYFNESQYRSNEEPLYHGCITYGGSNGVGDHSFGLRYLDAKGDLHTVYDARELGGSWIRELDADLYDAVFYSVDAYADVTYYQIDGTNYYVIHSDDTDTDSLCEEYISLGIRKGMHFVSDDEIDDLIAQRAQKLGIEYDWMSEEELSWNRYWY